MANNFYTIVVSFKEKDGMESAFKEFLLSIIPIARQSEDCMQLDLHQALDNPSEFMFYEIWANKAALEKHIARAEVKAWQTQLENFLAEPYQASFWEQCES